MKDVHQIWYTNKNIYINLNHFIQESWLIFSDRNRGGSNSVSNGSSTSTSNVTIIPASSSSSGSSGSSSSSSSKLT